jgi:hypothetical protein
MLEGEKTLRLNFSTIQAAEAIVYPSYAPMIRDSLLAGIVYGVFRGLFGATLYCAGDLDHLVVPQSFAWLIQGLMKNHLRSHYALLLPPVSDNLPLGYRRAGTGIEVDSQQAERVRDFFPKRKTEQ